MTETGEILSELKRSRKEKDRLLGYINKYAYLYNFSPKSVGIYIFLNGHVIEDRYPTRSAQKEFERISIMYKNRVDFTYND